MLPSRLLAVIARRAQWFPIAPPMRLVRLFASETAPAAQPPATAGQHNLGILFNIDDRPGGLSQVLEVIAQHDLNLTHIESRPGKTRNRRMEFRVIFEGHLGDPRVASAMVALSRITQGIKTIAPLSVPWFPTRIADIDVFSTKTLEAGAELEADHPGFNDAEYRERRRAIVATGAAYRHGAPLPRIAYTAAETATWRVVYEKLRGYSLPFAVEEYNRVLPLLEKHCGYGADSIPQLQDTSDFLQAQTGFTLRPVGGLLSARDFLNGLALRVFFSTQYIRHHSHPLYTPEPDVVHELLGHAPMLADPDFADFSHEIGLASLGASDEDIKRLATCYWYGVEFGLAMQDGQRKAYGAGLLSSFGELEYACAPYRPAGGEAAFPEYRPWDPRKAASTPYPITKYQPTYFVAESLRDATARMRDFCDALNTAKGFNAQYDPATSSVTVDRAVIRGDYVTTLQF